MNICGRATRLPRKPAARSRRPNRRAPTCANLSWPVPGRRVCSVIKLLSDENFDGDILRGLLRRLPDLDVVRVQDVGLAGTPDPDLLAWAAGEERILLTHDRATVPGFAYDR